MSLKQRLLPLWALSASRVTQFWREPGAVFWTFGFPLLITVALGIAFRDQSPPASRVAIVAGGGSAAQRLDRADIWTGHVARRRPRCQKRSHRL